MKQRLSIVNDVNCQPFSLIVGHYSVGSNNEACLIYVTSSGRIYIYHNIKLAHVQTVSLIEALEGSDKVKEFTDKMGMIGTFVC